MQRNPISFFKKLEILVSKKNFLNRFEASNSDRDQIVKAQDNYFLWISLTKNKLRQSRKETKNWYQNGAKKIKTKSDKERAIEKSKILLLQNLNRAAWYTYNINYYSVFSMFVYCEEKISLQKNGITEV